MTPVTEVKKKYEKAISNLEKLKEKIESPQGIGDDGYQYAQKVIAAIVKDVGIPDLDATTLNTILKANELANEIVLGRYHYKY